MAGRNRSRTLHFKETALSISHLRCRMSGDRQVHKFETRFTTPSTGGPSSKKDRPTRLTTSATNKVRASVHALPPSVFERTSPFLAWLVEPFRAEDSSVELNLDNPHRIHLAPPFSNM